MTGSLYGVEGVAHLTGCFNRAEHIIEEYTGMKDINLNKIFEGDVLDFTARYKQKGNVPVVYSGSSYECLITNESGLRECWDLSHVVQQYYPKIVGTIYDNDLVP